MTPKFNFQFCHHWRATSPSSSAFGFSLLKIHNPNGNSRLHLTNDHFILNILQDTTRFVVAFFHKWWFRRDQCYMGRSERVFDNLSKRSAIIIICDAALEQRGKWNWGLPNHWKGGMTCCNKYFCLSRDSKRNITGNETSVSIDVDLGKFRWFAHFMGQIEIVIRG